MFPHKGGFKVLVERSSALTRRLRDIISYFSNKAAEEKIDPIDFAFPETTDAEHGCMSPRPKPQRLVGP